MAELLQKGLQARGYRFYLESPTNQLFIVLENAELERLQKQVVVGFWERLDDNHTVVRLATSWATRAEDVVQLLELLG